MKQESPGFRHGECQIEDNNHYWEYKLTQKAIDMAKSLNLH